MRSSAGSQLLPIIGTRRQRRLNGVVSVLPGGIAAGNAAMPLAVPGPIHVAQSGEPLLINGDIHDK